VTEYERFWLVFTKTRVYKFGHWVRIPAFSQLAGLLLFLATGKQGHTRTNNTIIVKIQHKQCTVLLAYQLISYSLLTVSAEIKYYLLFRTLCKTGASLVRCNGFRKMYTFCTVYQNILRSSKNNFYQIAEQFVSEHSFPTDKEHYAVFFFQILTEKKFPAQ
jgi:hypothetical protein